MLESDLLQNRKNENFKRASSSETVQNLHFDHFQIGDVQTIRRLNFYLGHNKKIIAGYFIAYYLFISLMQKHVKHSAEKAEKPLQTAGMTD